jgi:hypothetical protein
MPGTDRTIIHSFIQKGDPAMNYPAHRGHRHAAALLCCLALLLCIGTSSAQPYEIPDPCSHYTITYTGGSPAIAGTIPVDVELKHLPDVVPYPSIIRHYDVGTSTSSSQSYGFTGNLYYFGSITVYGSTIPKDGLPHRVATGTPGVCVSVTITNDETGCPVITITPVQCCEQYTVIWDNFAAGYVVIERADHTTIDKSLPNNPDPDIDVTIESPSNDLDNPVIGIIVDGRHLGPGSTYRIISETAGGAGHCLEYSVSTDPSTGCLTISVHVIPCPPHCENYTITVTDNCQASMYFPLAVDVEGHAHLGPSLNDHWTYWSSGSHSYPIPISVYRVEDVTVMGVDIPIDGLPHTISIPGTNDHYRYKVTATFNWQTGCTDITIDCIHVIG